MAGGNQYLIKIGAIADDQSFEKEVSSAISRIENTSKSKLKIDLDMSDASVADINKAISQLQTAANANGVQLDFRQQEVALMSLLQTHEKYNAIRKTGTDAEINNVKTLLAQEQKAYQEKYGMLMSYKKTKEVVASLGLDEQNNSTQRAKEEKAAITDLNKALADYNKTSLELARAQAKDDQDLFKNEAAETYINTLKKLQAEQLQTKEEAQKLAAEFIGLDAAQEKADASAKKLDQQIQALDAQMGRTQGTLKTLSSKFTDGLGIGIAMRAVNGLEDAIYSGFREIITTTRELETAMTDIQIVTGDTRAETEALMLTYSELAQSIGATTLETANAANDFLRMGMNTADTNKMIEASMTLSKLGMIESAEATSYLISATQGYNVAANDAMEVVDRLTAVDMEAAVSAGYLAEAMSRTANSAKISGLEMNELLGIIATVGHETQQSASRVGEAWKTATARYRNVKLEKYVDAENPEEVEGINDIEIALANVDIALRHSNGEWREYWDILNDVNNVWGELKDADKNAITNALFGTRQAEFGLATFENFDQVLELTEVSMNSLGTATEKYAIYQEQLDAKLNTMIAKFEEMVLVSGAEGLLGNLISLGSEFLDIINDIGGLETALNATIAVITILNYKSIIGLGSSLLKLASTTGLVAAGFMTTNVATLKLNAGLLALKIGIAGVAAAAAILIIGLGYLNQAHEDYIKSNIESASATKSNIDTILDFKSSLGKAEQAGEDIVPILDEMAISLGEDAEAFSDAAGSVKEYRDSLLELTETELKIKKGELEESKDVIEQELLNTAKNRGTYSGTGEYATQQEFAPFKNEYDMSEVDDIVEYHKRLQEEINDLYIKESEGEDVDSWRIKWLKDEKEALDELVNSYVNSSEGIKDVDDAISDLEDGSIDIKVETDNIEDATDVIEESADEMADAVSAYEAAADAISRIDSEISLLSTAQEELASTGMLTASTLQSLMDNNLIQYFSVVNGQLQMSEDAFLRAGEAARINAVETLKTAMMADLAALAEGNMAEMSNFAANALRNAGWSAEESGVRAANSIGNLIATGDAWQYLHDKAQNQISGLSGNVKSQGEAIVNAYADVAAMVGQINISPTFSSGGGSGSDSAAQDAINQQQEAYNKLLEMTIAMIKQQKEDEKDLLEQQLEGYEKIIDAKKELLKIEQEQRDYQKDVEERSRDIAELETEIEELKYDTSAEGTARRLELEEELAEKKGELEDVQYEESIQRQEDALDAEYERYKEQIDMQIDEIDRFLQQTGTITAMAMDMIEQRSDHLYQSLINWNRMYGDSLDQTVIDAWNGAAAAAANYNSVVASGATASGGGGSYGNGSSYGGYNKYEQEYAGTIYGESDFYRNPNINTNTNTPPSSSAAAYAYGYSKGTNNASGLSLVNEFDKEAIVTPYGTIVDLPSKGNNGSGVVTSKLTQNLSTLGEIAPNIISKLSTSLGKVEDKNDTTIGTLMSINVESGGILDKTVIPTIENIAEKTIAKINNITQRVGTPKNAKFGMI